MASTLVARRASAAASSPLLKRLIHAGNLRPVAATASPVRSFSTDLQASGAGDDNRALDVERRPQRGLSRRPDSFPSLLDGFDPFSPSRSLSQMFNLMDHFFDTPFLGYQPGSGAGTGSGWRGWSAREDDKALHIRKDMPGVEKDKVKIRVEQDTLIIQGESEKDSEDDDEPARRYSSRLTLPSDQYKVDQIKAEMKNGVLKVTVPKVEEAERKDVKEITVE